MSERKNLASLRREYIQPTFTINQAAKDPFSQFDLWFEEMTKTDNPDVNAFSIATVDKSGRPSIRVVLLKGIEENKFVFFTNYGSQKGREIDENENVCLNFYWPELSRQVRIDGKANRISEEKSNAYFNSRPRGSQIGAWASPQSAIVTSRELLEERYKNIEQRFEGKDVPKPKQWGGYEISPLSFEFWQGRPNRLHDRILYLINEDGDWAISRLAP